MPPIFMLKVRPMSDHIPLTTAAFSKADEYVFSKILDPALPFLEALGAPVMVTDSSAVRAYTGKCRWMGDVDFLVEHASPATVLAVMKKHFANIIIGNPDGFFRAVFDLPVDCAGVATGLRFLIDVHVNAIFHRGQPTVAVPHEDFDLVEWKFVSSFGDLCCSRLPIPPLKTILTLKADKGIGNDLLDVFTLVAFANVEMAWLNGFLQPALSTIMANMGDICRLYELHYHENSAQARDRFLSARRG